MVILYSLQNVSIIVSIITGILGILGTCSGIYLKYSKKIKEKQTKKSQEKKKLSNVFDTVDKLVEKVDKIVESQEEIKEQYNSFAERFDSLETQELRYMINDSFLGYDSIHEVPDEQLLNAADCCEIYLGKGLNHATGARCKLIAEEIEKRARIRAGVDEDGKK